MDQLIIKGLELFAYHGVNIEEKAMGQKFILDIVIDVDLSLACETDDLNHAINYATLCHELNYEFNLEKYDLIEHAAEQICKYVLLKYEVVQKIDLTLKKPWAPVLMPLEYPAVHIVRSRHIAYIAVGSNLGDKALNIEKAFELIEKSTHTKILKKSEIIQTDPVGYEDQDVFLNGVFKVSTILGPKMLMRWLMDIEADLKRERVIKWGPRTLDLDIIYFDQMISDDDEIILPHPRMHERLFVLKPLAEIAPYYVHPIFGQRTIDLLNKLEV